MEISSLTKLIVCVIVIIAASVLGLGGVIKGESVVALLSGVLGYVYGNGHGIMSASNKSKEQ